MAGGLARMTAFWPVRPSAGAAQMSLEGRFDSFEPMTGGGRFRRIYVIPGRFGDGRLTDPTAAARRKPRPALSDRRQGLRPGEPPEGKLDGSEGDKGGEGFSEVLEILGKPPVAAEPGEGALDHPTAR